MALATLTIDLEARVANLENDLGKAAQVAEKNSKRMEAAFDGAAKSLKLLFAGYGAGQAWKSFILDTADAGDKLSKMSAKTDLSVEELSKLNYAAGMSGVSLDELGGALTKLNRVMGAARDGSQASAEALARFGVTASDSTLDAFTKIADRVKNTDDIAKTSTALSDVFGRSFAQLIPVLQSGSEGLKAAGDELERMGGVMSTEAAEAASKFNDNITRLSKSFEVFRTTTGNSMIPALQDILDFTVRAQKEFGTFSGLVVGLIGGSALKGLGVELNELKRAETEVQGLFDKRANLKNRIRDLDTTAANAVYGVTRNAAKNEATALRADLAGLDAELKAAIKNRDQLSASAASDSASLKPKPALGIGDAPATSDTKKSKYVKDSYTEAAKYYADAINKMDEAQKTAQRSTLDLNDAQAALLDLIQSGDWENYPESWRQAAIEAASTATEVINVAEKQKELNDILANTPTAKLDAVREKMVLIAEAYNDGRLGTVGSEEAMQKYGEASGVVLDGVVEKTKEAKSTAEELGLVFSSAAEDALVHWGGVGKLLKSIGEDILKIMVRKNVTNKLADAIGSFDWSSLFAANAKGGVYDSPSLSAFSNGVYTSPRTFAFANGAGIFAEAGPEAIMPLSRGRDGKLGVASQGGGGGVVVNVIESPGNGGQTSQRQDGNQTIIDVMVDKVKSSVANDILRGNGGVPSAMERTYGLSRAAGAY